MTEYVVDTDVLSYALRDDLRASEYRPYLEEARLTISFMTFAEMQFGAMKANWGAERTARLKTFLRQFIVYHETERLCETWAALRASVESLGKHLSPSDGWVAATAVLLDLPLLSHNRRDYANVPGLQLISFTQ